MYEKFDSILKDVFIIVCFYGYLITSFTMIDTFKRPQILAPHTEYTIIIINNSNNNNWKQNNLISNNKSVVWVYMYTQCNDTPV